jgi:excisionase family DNA binding protein
LVQAGDRETKARAVGSWLSVAAVARLLGVSAASIYKLCARGELPHVRISNAIRIDADRLKEILHKHRR